MGGRVCEHRHEMLYPIKPTFPVHTQLALYTCNSTRTTKLSGSDCCPHSAPRFGGLEDYTYDLSGREAVSGRPVAGGIALDPRALLGRVGDGTATRGSYRSHCLLCCLPERDQGGG